MYKFTRLTAGGFYVHVSKTNAGQTHEKRFSSDATTLTQDTANLYLKGRHRVSCGSADGDVFEAGSCSIDKSIAFVGGELVVEQPLEDGLRICVSPITGKWSRRVAEGDFTTNDGDVLIPLIGTALVGDKSIGIGDVAVAIGEKQVRTLGRVFVATPR